MSEAWTTPPAERKDSEMNSGKNGGADFEQLDNIKFGWVHVKAILVAGIGFFCDAYDLFCINVIVPMIGYAYWGGISNMPALDQTLIKGAAVIGTFCGQIVFGILADVYGRKSVYAVSLALMILGAFGSALSCSAVRGINITAMLTLWRFVLGIGIGGDYPLSAVITSEYATVHTRGRMMGAVFAMQGFGQLTAAIVAMVVLSIFKGAIDTDTLNVDYCWRICVGLGMVPAVLGAYFRAKLPETPRFTAQIKGDVSQAKRDIEAVLSNKYNASDAQSPPPGVLINSPMTSSSATISRADVPRERITVRSFLDHNKKWHNLKVLLGTSLSWFCLDVAFYGLGLNQSLVLTAIGYTAPTSQPYNYLFSVAAGNALVNLLGSIPGYWATVATVETLGRKKIQMGGFIILTVLFLILSAGYTQIKAASVGLFIFLYCLAQFFQNFGPNTTTYIVAGEAFPTKYRATSSGFAAATGKLGAILASYGFGYIATSPPKGYIGIQLLLGILTVFMFLGALTTILIPETAGVPLEEIGQDDD